ncbi:hypothetical protein RCL1_007744 [Eukaryota sp. TZLM3-RCL]
MCAFQATFLSKLYMFNPELYSNGFSINGGTVSFKSISIKDATKKTLKPGIVVSISRTQLHNDAVFTFTSVNNSLFISLSSPSFSESFLCLSMSVYHYYDPDDVISYDSVNITVDGVLPSGFENHNYIDLGRNFEANNLVINALDYETRGAFVSCSYCYFNGSINLQKLYLIPREAQLITYCPENRNQSIVISDYYSFRPVDFKIKLQYRYGFVYLKFPDVSGHFTCNDVVFSKDLALLKKPVYWDNCHFRPLKDYLYYFGTSVAVIKLDLDVIGDVTTSSPSDLKTFNYPIQVMGSVFDCPVECSES